MIQTNEIIGLMAKNGITKADLADKMGMNRNTLSKKLKSGKFGMDEIDTLIDVLNIPKDDWIRIFFNKNSLKRRI